MNNIHHPKHPLWALLASSIRVAIMMGSLVAVLWLNAENFDNTELQTLLTMFFIGAGSEGAGAILGTLFRRGE